MFKVLSQRTYFFNDSIRYNLMLARPTVSEADLYNAIEQTRLGPFVAALPNGLETIIGERGLRLSAGERQRLGVARALVKGAPIYLLDEPTANLDPLTERAMLDTLFSLMADRSMLLITHRLVRLEHMDEILVLDRGRIVERGTQATLLAAGGLYRRLYDLQNRILSETKNLGVR